MNKLVMLLVTLMVTLFGANAMAFTPPDAPAKGWYVVDKAGKLSQSEIARLNQKIEQVSRTTKNEFGVLVLDTMDGGNIEDAAYDTFKKWGVGKHGLDNGVLVVISVKERKSRIETGKGVGGEVPDLKAKEILDRNLAPHLKRGDFYGGLDETLSALSSLIESRHNEKATPRPTPVATPTHTTATSPATTSNPVGVTPPTSGPRTNSGGCSAAPVGASTDGDGFFVMVIGLGFIFLGGWLVARRARNKKRAEAEARVREEQARQARILAQRKLQEELEAAARERDRILNLPTPAVAVPSIRPVAPPRPIPIRKVVAPIPAPVPRPTPRVETLLPKVDPRPIRSAPTSVVAAGEAIAAAAAATALRRRQEETAAEERRIQEAGEENRRRQARREAEAEEERQAEARREARRQEERYEEERRAQARREEEERYEARRREQEEDDRRRREEESRSSYSSYDSGSSSSDSDSGGGFGGGDSGGGGASSDW